MSTILFFYLTIFIFFVINQTVCCIRLPGDCPKVPTTHTLPKLSLYPEVLAGIPFNRPFKSYLFKLINDLNVGYFKVEFDHDNAKDLLAIVLSHHSENSIIQTVSQVTNDPLNHRLNISSQIAINTNGLMKGDSLKCMETIHESISLWMDDGLIIIYSCATITIPRNYSDQAVLLLYVDPAYKDNATFLKRTDLYTSGMKAINETTRKYLSKAFVDALMKPTGHLKITPVPDDFACQRRPLQNWMSITVVVSLLCFFSIWLYISVYGGVSSHSQNYVHPFMN